MVGMELVQAGKLVSANAWFWVGHDIHSRRQASLPAIDLEDHPGAHHRTRSRLKHQQLLILKRAISLSTLFCPVHSIQYTLETSDEERWEWRG